MTENTKHKDAVTTLSQRRTIGCIDVVSSLLMKISPTSVDNIVAALKSHVVATLWQRSANVVTTLQSRNFTKCLTTSSCVNVVSANILLFLRKLPFCKFVNHTKRLKYESFNVRLTLAQRQNNSKIILNVTNALNSAG